MSVDAVYFRSAPTVGLVDLLWEGLKSLAKNISQAWANFRSNNAQNVAYVQSGAKVGDSRTVEANPYLELAVQPGDADAAIVRKMYTFIKTSPCKPSISYRGGHLDPFVEQFLQQTGSRRAEITDTRTISQWNKLAYQASDSENLIFYGDVTKQQLDRAIANDPIFSQLKAARDRGRQLEQAFARDLERTFDPARRS